jgi:RNA polymerase sigma-70 factor (ECF subfamily)
LAIDAVPGDTTTLDGAFRRYSRTVHGYLLRRTRDTHRAEDLTQEVFLAAVADLDRRPAGTPVLAWLYTVAQRRLADDLRRRGRRVEALPFEEEAVGGVEPSEYGPVVARAIKRAVRELSPTQQRVFVMKVLEGRPFAEIAPRLGVSEGAARNHLMHALRQMRASLERDGLEP